MPDAVVLVAVDVVVVVDAESAQHRYLSPAPSWLLPLTRFVNHLMDNIHPDRDWRKVKVLLRMFAIESSCVDCSLQM